LHLGLINWNTLLEELFIKMTDQRSRQEILKFLLNARNTCKTVGSFQNMGPFRSKDPMFRLVGEIVRVRNVVDGPHDVGVEDGKHFEVNGTSPSTRKIWLESMNKTSF
jgi:hypothetical protein